jgi:hypothetical protein
MEEMKQLFSLLEEDGSGVVCANELLRAQILSHAEVQCLQDMAEIPVKGWSQLSFEQFRDSASPILVEKFLCEEARSKYLFDARARWEDCDVKSGMKESYVASHGNMSCPWSCLSGDKEPERLIPPENLKEEDHAPAPPPVPPGAVAALIASLTANAKKQGHNGYSAPSPPAVDGRPCASPVRQRFKSDMDVSQVCGAERSPVVSAF